MSRPISRRAPGRDATITAALIAGLIISQTVPISVDFLGNSGANWTASDPVARTLKYSILAMSILLLSSRIQQATRLLKHTNTAFLYFLALVPLSILWSIGPADTIARFISIMTVVIVDLTFCTGSWHPRRFQSVLRPVITYLLIGSVIFCIVAPDLGVEQGDGTLKNAWRGLAFQKNAFGELSTFGVIFWLNALLGRQVNFWRGLLGTALAFSCVILSRSSTSLLAAIFTTLFMLLFLRSSESMRRYFPVMVALFAIIVVTYALAVLDLVPGISILLQPIAAFTGKDMTFSGRSDIWQLIKAHIQYAPLLGTGYGAYWIGPIPSSPSYDIVLRLYYYPAESHNGYLEIVNDLGYVGLVCLLTFLFIYVRQALAIMKVDRNQGVLFLGLFFQQAIANLSQSRWLAINSGFAFSIITLAVTSMARTLADQASRRPARRQRSGRQYQPDPAPTLLSAGPNPAH